HQRSLKTDKGEATVASPRDWTTIEHGPSSDRNCQIQPSIPAVRCSVDGCTGTSAGSHRKVE
ncbi:hypothetical protein BaRGS_00012506, partial [Batillaria attramentaria]